MLIALMPGVVLAADTDTAVLYSTGSVYLNGAQLSNSSAVTVGDVIQPKDTGAANLNAAGSSVVTQSNTIVRFQSGGLALDRGGISLATGKGMSISARDFKIVPISGGWTEFYVSRVSGVIQNMARRGGISASCGPNTSTVKEGQQISRDDAANCGLVDKNGGGATPAAKGPILDSNAAQGSAVGAGGALLIWVLTRKGDSGSPSAP